MFRTPKGVTLRGDHNICTGCGELFNSTKAFDKHRIGAHGVNRQCMEPDHMLAIGMAKNADGWWVTSLREMSK